MLFWLIIVVMLAATLAALFLPILWGQDSIEARESYDANVFKDQLKAIDRDLEEGLIDQQDAEAARIEISRKLLEAAQQADAHPEIRATQARLETPVLVGLGVVCATLALGIYGLVGNPATPDLPLQARLQKQPEKQQLSELIARAEMQLEKNPSDGRGWAVMAPIYIRHGLYDKAVNAYNNAIKLLGPTGDRLTGLADAMIFANEGVVSEATLPVLQQAIKIAPDLPKPRFWLALYNEQNGKSKEAMDGYTEILQKSVSDAPWRSMVQDRLDELRKKQGLPKQQIAGIEPPAQPMPPMSTQPQGKGPSAEDIKRANEMSPEQRQAMVNTMVDNLAERLRTEGGDVASWIRLVNAYMVLGKKDEAQNAIKLARKNLGNDKQALTQLDELARRLGLES